MSSAAVSRGTMLKRQAWDVALHVIGLLLAVLLALGLVYAIAEFLLTVVLPSVIKAVVFVGLFGGLAFLAWTLFARFRREAGENARHEALRRKLEGMPKVTGAGLDELSGGKTRGLEAELVDEGKPCWGKVSGFLSGLKGLVDLFGATPPDLKAGLSRKSEVFLGELLKRTDLFQGLAARDLELREREAQRGEEETSRQKAEEARAKEESLRLEVEKESTRARALELERAKKMGSFGVEALAEGLVKRLSELDGEVVPPKDQPPLYEAYLRLRDVLQKTSDVPLEARDRIAPDELGLLQLSALLNRYSEHMTAVRLDERLSDEEKEKQLAIWERLRTRDVRDLTEGDRS